MDMPNLKTSPQGIDKNEYEVIVTSAFTAKIESVNPWVQSARWLQTVVYAVGIGLLGILWLHSSSEDIINNIAAFSSTVAAC